MQTKNWLQSIVSQVWKNNKKFFQKGIDKLKKIWYNKTIEKGNTPKRERKLK